MFEFFKDKTFSHFRGVRLPKMKDDKKVDVFELDDPKYFYVPMLQQKDREATVCVEIGEKVKKGTIIGKTPMISIFSPCSGTVRAISNKPSMQGKICKHVIIENDYKDEKQYFSKMEDINQINILKRIVEAGILDRNGNPLISIINTETYGRIESIIINACADEPYVTNNISLAINFGKQMAEAIKLLTIATGVKNVIFAITKFTNDKSEDYVSFLTEYFKREEFKDIHLTTEIVQDRYPIGDETELLFAITKKRLCLHESPKNYGHIIVDTSVLLPLYSAVIDSKPDIERLVSLTGCHKFVTEPYFVKYGTQIDFIINQTVAKKRLDNIVKIVAGGPFRGVALSDTSVAFDKAQISLLFLTTSEIYIDAEKNCIECGKCSGICPRKLMPFKIDRAFYAEDYITAKKFGAEYCSECGCCAYICPAKRHLVQRIAMCKKEINRKGIEKCH